MKVKPDGVAAIDLGTTETTPTIGITDYSRRVTDDFGVTTVVERGFSRRMSVRMAVPTDTVDAVQRQLANLRATSALWIADASLQWLNVVGFYKDFALDLAVPPLSFCTLTVEGLAETEVVADGGGDPAPAGSASTLRLLQPITVDDAQLFSASVPENDAAAWASGTTYADGARVIRAHRIWESLAGGNVGNDPTTTTGSWLDTGPTNRWAMFDQALGTATTATGSLSATLAPSAPIGAVAFLDAAGATVRVQAMSGSTTVYDQSVAVAGRGVVTFTGLPQTANLKVIATLTGATGSAPIALGTLLAGAIVPLGITEASPSAGIADYSRKEVDDFGAVTIVQRAWAKRMSAQALIRSDAVDLVANRIAAVRARPALWIGDSGLDSLSVYGFFKDFSIEVGDTVSKLSLSIEGLSKAAPVAPPFGAGGSQVTQGSADATNWHLGLLAGDEYMRISNDGGATYGPAIKIVDEAGQAGEDGAYQQLIFRRAATRPATPTGGGIPAGWYDGVPPDGDDPLWWSVQYQRNGVSLGPWSTPGQISGQDGKDGAPAQTISLSSDKQIARYSAANAYIGGSITFTAIRQNIPGTGTFFAIYRVSDNALLGADTSEGLASGVPSYYAGSGGDKLVMSPTAISDIIAAHGTFRVEAFRDGYASRDSVSIMKVQDGQSALNAVLSNPHFNIPTAADGSYGVFPGDASVTGQMIVYLGTTDVTNQCTFTIQNPYALDGRVNADGSYYAVGLYADTGYSFVVASYNGQAIALKLTANKTRAGANGATPPNMILSATALVGKVGSDGNYLGGQSVTWSAQRNSAAPGPTIWNLYRGNGGLVGNGYAQDYVNSWPGYFTRNSDDSLTLNGAGIAAFLDAYGDGPGKITMRASSVGVYDEVDLTRVKDGANGQNGVSPLAVTASPASFQVAADYKGVPKPDALPIAVNLPAKIGGTPVALSGLTLTTSGCAASVNVDSGNPTGFTVTSMTGDATIIWAATAGGQSASGTVTGSRVLDAPPPTSAKQNFSGYSGFNVGSYPSTGPVVSITIPNSGSVTAFGYMSYRGGNGHVKRAKLQYRINGGTWTDIPGSQVDGSETEQTTEDTVPPRTINLPGDLQSEPAALTGLPVGGTLDMQMVAYTLYAGTTSNTTNNGYLQLTGN